MAEPDMGGKPDSPAAERGETSRGGFGGASGHTGGLGAPGRAGPSDRGDIADPMGELFSEARPPPMPAPIEVEVPPGLFGPSVVEISDADLEAEINRAYAPQQSDDDAAMHEREYQDAFAEAAGDVRDFNESLVGRVVDFLFGFEKRVGYRTPVAEVESMIEVSPLGFVAGLVNPLLGLGVKAVEALGVVEVPGKFDVSLGFAGPSVSTASGPPPGGDFGGRDVMIGLAGLPGTISGPLGGGGGFGGLDTTDTQDVDTGGVFGDVGGDFEGVGAFAPAFEAEEVGEAGEARRSILPELVGALALAVEFID